MTTKQIFLSLLIVSSLFAKAQESKLPVEYVDTKIGTSDDGSNCVIGPQLPFGSINPSPQTPDGHHDGYDPEQPIRGFGQLHVSGTGWGKYGQIFVSPQIGLEVEETKHDSPKASEIAKAYEYGVTLTRYSIRTEMTPSFHSAIYRFIFPKSNDSHITIDLSHNIPRDIATIVGGQIHEGTINIDHDKSTIYGYGVYSGGFGQGQYPVYFIAQFSKEPSGYGTWINEKVNEFKNAEEIKNTNDNTGAYLKFDTEENDTIYMKIAVSLKNLKTAENWLLSEINDFNFEKVKAKAKSEWNAELSKIEIETTNEANKTIFYSALYHSMLMPRNRTNDMRGFDDGVSVWDDQYAVWDTWRSLFPLMVLIKPEMVAGNINSFIERLKTNKQVRDAFIAGNDMFDEQGGTNIDNIIADAFIKKVDGVYWDDAYKVVKYDADNRRLGKNGWNQVTDSTIIDIDFYEKNGWLPSGIMSCSYTLEYSYNDYCASQIANGLCKADDFEKYLKRSHQWINLWNENASSDGFKGFIIPKDANGKFLEIDLKKNWGSWKDYYYEGNSWTYSYFMPHDFSKLIALTGGKKTYTEKLNYAMKNNLIDYSNEPAFLTAHSFIYSGRPDLASYWTRKLLNEGYSLKGYPGNDDSGAMSSWYIFSSLGFFPNAGQDIYYLTGPLFPKSTIRLPNNKLITIVAENASTENIYVQSCSVNGKKWERAWINHEILINGATIKFVMGNKPSSWAQKDTSLDLD